MDQLYRAIYLRFIIQPINAPAVKPTANVVATVSAGVVGDVELCHSRILGSIAALFRGAPYDSYSLFDGVANCAGCARSLGS